ncbi:LAMI_0B04060g1_1 [Lachancea mirantina]|uniref:Putative transcription factor kapC n=1 Tax=Lachancea mirantina TaxID=1230905 RepID=A0A1G4IVS2_9SACH|nr:LAMI_0B04060g1_1 [Lachancea mirantina]
MQSNDNHMALPHVLPNLPADNSHPHPSLPPNAAHTVLSVNVPPSAAAAQMSGAPLSSDAGSAAGSAGVSGSSSSAGSSVRSSIGYGSNIGASVGGAPPPQSTSTHHPVPLPQLVYQTAAAGPAAMVPSQAHALVQPQAAPASNQVPGILALGPSAAAVDGSHGALPLQYGAPPVNAPTGAGNSMGANRPTGLPAVSGLPLPEAAGIPDSGSVKHDPEPDQGSADGEHVNMHGVLIGKSGKPLRNTKRAAQNRTAQKAFRQRRERYIKELETKAKEYDRLEQEVSVLGQENQSLKQYVLELEQRLGVRHHPGV